MIRTSDIKRIINQKKWLKRVAINKSLANRFNHSIKVFPEKGVFYIETPKVACSSIKGLLLSSLTKADVPHDQSVHATANESLLSPEKIGYEHFFKLVNSGKITGYALVRDPIERLKSAYRDKIARSVNSTTEEPFQRYRQEILDHHNSTAEFPTYQEFLAHISYKRALKINHHWAPQVDVLFPDLIKIKKVYGLEHIDDFVADISEKLDFSAEVTTYNKTDSSTHLHSKLYTCDDITMSQITDLYIRDSILHNKSIKHSPTSI